MKEIQKSITVALALAAFLLGSSVLMAAPKTKADHEAIAAKYEKLAAEQEAVVKEHTDMEKDYRANAASLPKQSREKSLAEMDQHCDALITAAKKEAEEYKAIAQWHKIRASEFEK